MTSRVFSTYESSMPVLRQLVIGTLTGVAIGYVVARGGETAIGLLYGVTFTILLGIWAYRYPVAAVSAWALLSVHLREFTGTRDISVGAGVDALPSDPVLVGMALALFYALVSGDRRVTETLKGPLLMWMLLLAWLGFEIVRSVPDHGIVSTLGEFRRTFQALLVLPYICVFFRTREQQGRLLRALVILSFLFVLLALWKGAMMRGFAISSRTRWMVSYSNISLLWGVVALFVAYRAELWRDRRVSYTLLILLAITLTIICNHRSVWLAGASVAVVLVVFRQLSLSTVFKLALAVVSAGILLDFVYSEVDLFKFLRVRLTAFTSYEQDQTASWRFYVWEEALRQAKAHWLAGKGLGNYFSLYLPDGRHVTTVLHNVYVQLVYQIGSVGLLLYLAHVGHVFRYLWRTSRDGDDRQTVAISVIGMIVLCGGSVYYLAYTLDVFTWLYVGLGLAAAGTVRAEKVEYTGA